jgi:hypothetical protein
MRNEVAPDRSLGGVPIRPSQAHARQVHASCNAKENKKSITTKRDEIFLDIDLCVDHTLERLGHGSELLEGLREVRHLDGAQLVSLPRLGDHQRNVNASPCGVGDGHAIGRTTEEVVVVSL